jgi:hypothetical protein
LSTTIAHTHTDAIINPTITVFTTKCDCIKSAHSETSAEGITGAISDGFIQNVPEYPAPDNGPACRVKKSKCESGIAMPRQ